MILTPEIQQTIVDAIEEDRSAPILLPDHSYNADGRVLVLIDGIAIDLHRHLHNVLIRPLEFHERMHDQSGSRGNVNPYLFKVVEGNRSPATHCRKGHEYEGNEMPPNSRGYRCRTCYLDSQPRKGGSNAEKTQCPQGHPYDTENTIVDSAGRRRCAICTKKTKRESARRRRASRKEQP